MITKILIANRGEIACRIIHTAKRLGLKSVAVFSDADKDAQHVKLADEAFYLGGSSPSESYLCGDKIIDIALNARVDAIHPGYGFLSENADFAKACQQNDIHFIGPSSDAIDAMGSKSAAKAIMSKAKVPLVPGYHGDEQAKDHLLKQGKAIGFPLLIKAAYGGGGKGMRIVEADNELSSAIDSAKREAKSAFGNDKLLLERYLTDPRHIEVQVFADKLGNFVYLADRDCSIQRRHQKVIEEAPAPNLAADLRKNMGEAAVAAAKAIDYVGAGTVEFLLDANGKDFFFMEMNTRLQVEHPVTEMVTGQDLVAWQIAVADSKPLPLAQNQICVTGHAFEARIYAEDPDNDFLPASGHLDFVQEPELSEHVRIDSGVVQGDEISNFYDPMIAKLISWNTSREKALASLSIALDNYHILGIRHNTAFLNRIARHTAFKQGQFSTGFIEQHKHSLFTEYLNSDQQDFTLVANFSKAKAIAGLWKCFRQQQDNMLQAQSIVETNSPWACLHNFSINSEPHCSLSLWSEYGEAYELNIVAHKDEYMLELDEQKFVMFGEIINEHDFLVTINGHQFHATVFDNNEELTLFYQGEQHHFKTQHSLFDNETEKQENNLNAPMNGTIVTHLVNSFEQVNKGQGLMVMEAMKMEYTIHAPVDGVVTDFYFHPGDLVSDGALLVEFEPTLHEGEGHATQ